MRDTHRNKAIMSEEITGRHLNKNGKITIHNRKIIMHKAENKI